MYKKMLFVLAVLAPGCTDHVAECNKAKVAARDAWGKVVQAEEEVIKFTRAAQDKAKAEMQATEAQYTELNKSAVAVARDLESASRDAHFAGAPLLLTTAESTHVVKDHPISRKFRIPELEAAYQATIKAIIGGRAAIVAAKDKAEDGQALLLKLEKRRNELVEIANSAMGDAVAFRDNVATAVEASDDNGYFIVIGALRQAKPASDAAWEACKEDEKSSEDEDGSQPPKDEVGVFLQTEHGWVKMPSFEYDGFNGGFKGTEDEATIPALPVAKRNGVIRLQSVKVDPSELYISKQTLKEVRVNLVKRMRWDVEENPMQAEVKKLDEEAFEVRVPFPADQSGGRMRMLVAKTGQYSARAYFFRVR